VFCPDKNFPKFESSQFFLAIQPWLVQYWTELCIILMCGLYWEFGGFLTSSRDGPLDWRLPCGYYSLLGVRCAKEMDRNEKVS